MKRRELVGTAAAIAAGISAVAPAMGIAASADEKGQQNPPEPSAFLFGVARNLMRKQLDRPGVGYRPHHAQ